MSFHIGVLLKEIVFIALECILTYGVLLVYGTASHNPLFKKIWMVNAFLIVHDFCWYGSVCYRSIYREWFSDIPQPTYLLFARLLLLTWPLVIFSQVYIYECLLYVQWNPQKRHYVFGAVTLLLMGYLGYALFIRESISSDPWSVLAPFDVLISRSFIMIIKSTAVFIGIKRLLLNSQLPFIVRKQTKYICFMFVPSILVQPLWILQKYNITPQNDIDFEIFTFFVSLLAIGSFYYGFFALLRLRMFNAYDHVQELFPRNLIPQLTQACHDICDSKKLEEFGRITRAYFEKTFRIDQDDVTLYIRATHHESNTKAAEAVRTLDAVEAVFAREQDTSDAQPELWADLREKIKHKSCVVRAEVEYDEQFGLDAQASELRSFMEKINAEVFLPIFYHQTTLVGYIIVERTKHTNKVVSANELDNMLAYADYLGYAIADLQKGDIALVEKECFTYQRQSLQRLQELEYCYEGMRALMQAQTSEAVSMIYGKQRGLRVASADGAKLLGLPEGSLAVKGSYEQPIQQLMRDFKKYRKECSIVLKDAQRNPLRFSVMQDSKGRDAVVLVSRPTISEFFSFPSFANIHESTDWGYTVFLRLTTSGKSIERFIPASQGLLFDFKVKFLHALASRRPLLLLGAEDDVERLATLAHHSGAHGEGHTNFHELSLEHAEQDRKIAFQLFGAPALGSNERVQGVLTTLNVSGTLFIEHVERLSLETQELLARFFTTGLFSSFYSKQRSSSNAIVICSSQENLKQLVEQGLFSAALYEELMLNVLELPLLATMPKEQVKELIHGISHQVLKEPLGADAPILSNNSIDQLLAQLPESICTLRQQVKDLVEAQLPLEEVHTLVDAGFDDVDVLVAQARRQGRAALKNKQLFCALIASLKSYVRVAEILDVDRTTVYRTCKKYNLSVVAASS